MKRAQDSLGQPYVFLPSPRWPGKSSEPLPSVRSQHTTHKDSRAETTASPGLSPGAHGRGCRSGVSVGGGGRQPTGRSVWLRPAIRAGVSLSLRCPIRKWVRLDLLLASLIRLYFRASSGRKFQITTGARPGVKEEARVLAGHPDGQLHAELGPLVLLFRGASPLTIPPTQAWAPRLLRSLQQGDPLLLTG